MARRASDRRERRNAARRTAPRPQVRDYERSVIRSPQNAARARQQAARTLDLIGDPVLFQKPERRIEERQPQASVIRKDQAKRLEKRQRPENTALALDDRRKKCVKKPDSRRGKGKGRPFVPFCKK